MMSVAEQLATWTAELDGGGSSVRRRVLEELRGRDGSLPPALVTPLAACLDDPDRAVRRGAADALGRIEDAAAVRTTLTPLLHAEDAALAWTAAYVLARAGGVPTSEVIAVLLRSLGHADRDCRWATVAVLATHGQDIRVVDGLLDQADASDPVARRMSLYCLRDVRVEGARLEPLVLRRLVDPVAGVRLAALALVGGGVRTPAVAAAVATTVATDANVGVRRAAVAALRGCADLDVAREALRRAARAQDGDVRRVARRALGLDDASLDD